MGEYFNWGFHVTRSKVQNSPKLGTTSGIDEYIREQGLVHIVDVPLLNIPRDKQVFLDEVCQQCVGTWSYLVVFRTRSAWCYFDILDDAVAFKLRWV